MARAIYKTEARFKTNTRGLDVIQSVYAFAMALGLTEVFVGSRTFLNDIIFGAAPVNDGRMLLSSLLFANVVLLGIRFFWVPRNLGALVFRAAECFVKSRNVNESSDQLGLSNLSISFHLLIIIAHGALFFLVCSEFEYVVFLSSSSLPLNGSLFTGYIIMHVCLLLMNAAWIGLLKLQEQRLEERANIGDDETPSAGNTWWLNNLIASLLAIAPFSVLGSCHSELAKCAVRSNALSATLIDLSPASAHQISVIFQSVTGLLAWAGLSSPNATLVWVLFVLLGNSLVDLLSTARFYVLFEDVEWESEPYQSGSGARSARRPGQTQL